MKRELIVLEERLLARSLKGQNLVERRENRGGIVRFWQFVANCCDGDTHLEQLSFLTHKTTTVYIDDNKTYRIINDPKNIIIYKFKKITERLTDKIAPIPSDGTPDIIKNKI